MTIYATLTNGSIVTMSYCLTYMCRVILDMYSDNPTIASYEIR